MLEAFKKYFLKDVKINHINADTLIDRTLKTKNNTLNTTLWKNAGYDNVPTIEENIEELAKSNLSNRIMT